MAIREDLFRKLRKTATEFGQDRLNDAVIIGPDEFVSPISGHQYLTCPTLGQVTLGNVDWKVARFFEDA